MRGIHNCDVYKQGITTICTLSSKNSPGYSHFHASWVRQPGPSRPRQARPDHAQTRPQTGFCLYLPEGTVTVLYDQEELEDKPQCFQKRSTRSFRKSHYHVKKVLGNVEGIVGETKQIIKTRSELKSGRSGIME